MIDALLKKDLLPDWLIRIGIRRLLRERLQDEESTDNATKVRLFAEELRQLPILPLTLRSQRNNALRGCPTFCYQQCLGPRLKYSSCYYERGERITGPGRGEDARAHL